MAARVKVQESVEYAIVHCSSPHEIHRGPMTEVEADKWIKEFEQDGGEAGAFFVVSREVGPWELA